MHPLPEKIQFALNTKWSMLLFAGILFYQLTQPTENKRKLYLLLLFCLLCFLFSLKKPVSE